MKQTYDDDTPAVGGTISRRAFLRGLGTATVTAAAASATAVAKGLEEANAEKILGPGKVPVAFKLNGAAVRVEVEPRETLLTVLREQLAHTGPKEACDRGACGACTVLLNHEPVNACMKLAIDAADANVETIEGLAQSGELTAVQKAFVAADGLQCGFCTPGFVMSVTALLRKNPHPTDAEIRRACSGNLCRCGSYPHILAAARTVAGRPELSRLTILHPHHHGLA